METEAIAERRMAVRQLLDLGLRELFDRLTPEEVLTVGGACDEGVYTVEVADSTGPGQCKPGRCAAVPSAVPSA